MQNTNTSEPTSEKTNVKGNRVCEPKEKTMNVEQTQSKETTLNAEHRANSGSPHCSPSQDVALPTEPGLYWVSILSPVSGNPSKPAIAVVSGEAPYLSMKTVYPEPSMVLNQHRIVVLDRLTIPHSA